MRGAVPENKTNCMALPRGCFVRSLFHEYGVGVESTAGPSESLDSREIWVVEWIKACIFQMSAGMTVLGVKLQSEVWLVGGRPRE